MTARKIDPVEGEDNDPSTRYQPPAPPVPPAYPTPPIAPAHPIGVQKPGMVQAIGIMTLINGILNIVWGLSLTGTVVIGTFGFGLLCAPVTILPCILGIFEIIYAVKVMSNPPQPVRPSQTIAILEICMIFFGDILSLVAGILALVFYSDANVKAYFERINQPR